MNLGVPLGYRTLPGAAPIPLRPAHRHSMTVAALIRLGCASAARLVSTGLSRA